MKKKTLLNNLTLTEPMVTYPRQYLGIRRRSWIWKGTLSGIADKAIQCEEMKYQGVLRLFEKLKS